MKTVPEILNVGYKRTIGTGSIQTPGHSTLAEAAVVVPPQAFADGPHGEVLGEHVDQMEGHEKILDAHAQEGHLGTHFVHAFHEMTVQSGKSGVTHPGEFAYSDGNHPHELRGDGARHNPHHPKHPHHSRSHKHPHE